MTSVPVLDLHYRPRLPERTDYGIATIGCGGIVNYAHLPAYRAHGLRGISCYDINHEAAQSTAERYAIPRVYESLDAVFQDAGVDICGDTYATFRFLGTEGVIKGIIGLLYDYPHGRADSLQRRSITTMPDIRFDARLERRWILDAFIGPMASLMEAIYTDGTPLTDAADNLRTLRSVHAAYRSAAEQRSIRFDEL